MDCEYRHHQFGSRQRVTQPLSNDRCQNILYKAVFEHFDELEGIAALLLASKSFQNSSFGANFVINFVVDEDTIEVFHSVLSPPSCFSLQFVPTLHVKQPWTLLTNVNRGISNFVGELVKTKYIHVSLRSLTIECNNDDYMSCVFRSSTNAWPQLRDLSFRRSKLNDDDLKSISINAMNLRALDFTNSEGVTDAGLESISNLWRLTSLNLSACFNITDAGIEHLSKLSSLISLDLSECYLVTDAGLEHLSKFSGLTTIDLWGCDKITDAGIGHIAKLSSVTSLNLSGCVRITDAGLEFLTKLPAITSLDLFQCGMITDTGLEHLSKLPGLANLNLWGCDRITDAGLEHIANLSGITSLNLRGCDEISSTAKQKLNVALPKCNISSL